MNDKLSIKPFGSDPPYLFHIANHETDVPSALAFMRQVEEEAAERLEEAWAEARAIGIA